MDTKTCTKCLVTKESTEFYNVKLKYGYGLASHCKLCSQREARERQKQNRKKIFEKIKKQRNEELNFREQVPDYKKRCKNCNFLREISLFPILIDHCIYCENKLIKICSKCKQSKTLNCFYRDPSKIDNYCPQCKECQKPILNKSKKKIRFNKKEKQNKPNKEVKRTTKQEKRKLEEWLRSLNPEMNRKCKVCHKERNIKNFYGRSQVCFNCFSKETKKCSKCQEIKVLSHFTRAYTNLDGSSSHCIECDRKKGENYRNKNRFKLKERRKEKYWKNPEKQREKNRFNNIKYKEQKKQYTYQRRKNNIQVSIIDRLRCNVNSYIRLYSGREFKNTKTMDLLGCTRDFFVKYFESKFTEGMTWERFMNGEIHIGHIKPCCSFDLTDPEQQKQCFHYSNLEPQWSYYNLSKIQEDKKQSIWYL